MSACMNTGRRLRRRTAVPPTGPTSTVIPAPKQAAVLGLELAELRRQQGEIDELPEAAHPEYDALLAQATAVHRLPFTDSTADAHMRASERMLDLADELLAVWDGKPARGYGGTADVIDAARKRRMTVRVVWPPGATRDD
jgi:hypothetical protein